VSFGIALDASGAISDIQLIYRDKVVRWEKKLKVF
jgi:hypothetical protein